MEIDFVYIIFFCAVCLLLGILFAGQIYALSLEDGVCFKEQTVGEWLASGKNADPHALDSEPTMLVIVRDNNK